MDITRTFKISLDVRGFFYAALATCATLILPLTTPAMMADFTAVGGLLLLATGLRICGIKMFAVVNMLPALLLAMPLSALWTRFFA